MLRLATTVAALLLALTSPQGITAARAAIDDPCTRATALFGICPSTGDEIDVWGIRDISGSSGPGAPFPGAGERNEDSEPSGTPGRETPQCVLTVVGDPTLCRYRDIPESEAEPPGTPAITITDVASFKPAGALVSAEPNNLGIAGLPINLVAPASAQEVTGTIFDLPVSVRFTPVAFDFHTGDGTVVTNATGGSTWEQLGLPQFSPTATSHTYRERGTYDTHVETHYSAEVNLGTGWIMLAGTVTSVGATQQIRIFEAHTALVAHTCLETPTAPGC